MTALRNVWAKSPYTMKTARVIAMKTPLSNSSCANGDDALWSTNCGRKARKKMVSFGFRIFKRMALITRPTAVVPEGA